MLPFQFQYLLVDSKQMSGIQLQRKHILLFILIKKFIIYQIKRLKVCGIIGSPVRGGAALATLNHHHRYIRWLVKLNLKFNEY